jgi:hypothetical protein
MILSVIILFFMALMCVVWEYYEIQINDQNIIQQ